MTREDVDQTIGLERVDAILSYLEEEGDDRLTAWESDFMQDMADKKSFSAKQLAKIDDIYDKLFE